MRIQCTYVQVRWTCYQISWRYDQIWWTYDQISWTSTSLCSKLNEMSELSTNVMITCPDLMRRMMSMWLYMFLCVHLYTYIHIYIYEFVFISKPIDSTIKFVQHIIKSIGSGRSIETRSDLLNILSNLSIIRSHPWANTTESIQHVIKSMGRYIKSVEMRSDLLNMPSKLSKILLNLSESDHIYWRYRQLQRMQSNLLTILSYLLKIVYIKIKRSPS